MKWQHSKNTSQSPSSAIGIMKFNETMNGPKLTPETVVIATIAFAVLVIVLKFAVF